MPSWWNLVYIAVLETVAERLVGSNPTEGTKIYIRKLPQGGEAGCNPVASGTVGSIPTVSTKPLYPNW